MRVDWTAQALADREAIWLYVASDNPVAAERLDEAFADAVSRLSEFPELGKPALVAGVRELIPHPSYRLLYMVEPAGVRILSLIHTAREWPPLERDR